MPASTRLAKASRSMTHAYRNQRRVISLAHHADLEMARARAITDLAMRAAEMCLSSGATAARTTKQILNLCRAFDLPAQIDITYTRILLSYEPSVAADPITIMRTVRPGEVDYDRLTRVETLLDRIHTEKLTLEVASARLDNIRAEPRTYRPWVLLLAAAVLGGAVAALLGGNQADILVSGLATLLVEMLRGALLRRGVNSFFAQAVSAAIPTTFGLLAMAAHSLLPEPLQVVHASLVVAAGMVSLLAGLGIVTAAGDGIDGYYMSAGTRAVEVVVMTGAIVLGLVTTLWFGLWLGVPAYLSPAAGYSTTSVVEWISAGVIAASFAVLCNMGPRSVLAATVLGVLLQVSYTLTHGEISSTAARAGAAALVVGFVARLVTRPLRIPMVALISTAVAPLMPGLLLYRGVFALTNPTLGADRSSGEDGTAMLLRCLLTGVALAAGSSFGASMSGLILRAARRFTAS